VESLSQRLEIPWKIFCNLDKYGNTSAASIPIALDEARKALIFKKDNSACLLHLEQA